MSVSVSMPQLGESVTEGTVTRWLKREGDHVSADEPLLEVSTDKVDTEIPSPVSGILRGITVAEDETVAVGAELAVIDEDGAEGAAPPAAEPAQAPYGEPAHAEPTYQEPSYPAPSYQAPPAAWPPAPEAPPAAAEPGYAGQAYPSQEPPRAVEPEAYQPRSTGYENPPFAEPAPPAYQQASHTGPIARPPASQTGYAGYAADVQAPAGADQRAAAQPAEPEVTQVLPGDAEAPEGPEGPYVTPLVRKLAAEHGIDLATVQGTGVGGRIRKQDVLDAARQQGGGEAPAAAAAVAQAAPGQPAAAPPGPAVPPAVPPGPAAPPAVPGIARPPAPAGAGVPAAPPAAGAPERAGQAAAQRGRTERLSRARQVIAQRMVESLQTAAQLTTVVEADVTAIARLRDRTKAAFEAREGVKLSFLPFFALAAVEALKAHPKLNASIDVGAGTITYHDSEHLGIAVDTERGLMVPVIRNAGDLNIGGLARKIADLAQRTRAGQVSPDDLSGGTFTLTNTGSRGALFDTPIINQPQVAILGTGTVNRRPVVVDDPDLGEVITVRSTVYLALTYDHRLVDGADAARFLVSVKARLEEGNFDAELGH